MPTPPIEKHAVALALLIREAEVLLAHRHPQREWYPNCWDLPGGHIEPGESPEEAVRCEWREELGIEVRSMKPCAVALSDPQVYAHGFRIIEWRGMPKNLASSEHDQLRWVCIDDVRRLPLPDPALRAVLLQALLAGEKAPSE